MPVKQWVQLLLFVQIRLVHLHIVVEMVTDEPVVEKVAVEQAVEIPAAEVEKTILDEVAEVAQEQAEALPEEEEKEEKVLDLNKPYEEMSIEELQACILAKMAKNGPVTEEMKRTVDINVHHGSLMNWVRSFQ